jgi:DNA-binding CsgD family transcriptional regulator
MSLGEPDQLLDLVYEAAAIPDMWPAVLDRMAQIAGGVGTFLITADPRTIRWTSSGALRQLGLDILEGHWHERNTRMDRLMLHRHSGFMRDVDMWTLEEMDQDPSFRDLLRPRGFGWCGGFLVQVPSDDMLLFSVERRFGSSQTLPEDLLNGLFDLSPAEVRVANGLLQGKTIEDLAVGSGLSRETIRSQVKAVLAKTGTARQSDLVSLLANVNMPRWYQAR